MDDLISRAAAIEAIKRAAYWNDAERKITELPAVDAMPVIHGRWVKMTGMMPPEYHGHYECSECQWHMKGLRNSWAREEDMSFCPNCGAKMDGERRDGNAVN